MRREDCIRYSLFAQCAFLLLQVISVLLLRHPNEFCFITFRFFAGVNALGLLACLVGLIVLSERNAILRNLWVLLVHVAFFTGGLALALWWLKSAIDAI